MQETTRFSESFKINTAFLLQCLCNVCYVNVFSMGKIIGTCYSLKVNSNCVNNFFFKKVASVLHFCKGKITTENYNVWEHRHLFS